MKKVISVILALALCISLIPAAFATDTGYEWARNPKTYVYEFNNSAHETNTAEADNWLHKVEHSIATAASGTQEWGFVGLQNFHNYYTTDTWLNMAAHVREDGGTPYFGPGTNAPTGEYKTAFGLELDVDASGKYTPSITFKTGTSAPIVDIFLVEKPADENEAKDWYSPVRYNESGNASGIDTKNFYEHVENTDSSNRIGIGINMYGSTTVNKTVALSPVTLDANKNYFLLIVPCGKDPQATVEEYSSSAYDSAVIKLVSFELSEELTEENVETLEYIFDADVMNTEMIPKSTYSNGDSTSIRYNSTTGAVVALYNLHLANWKKTASVKHNGDAIATTKIPASGSGTTYVVCDPYYTLDLTKTAPYAIDSIISASGTTNGKLINGGNSNMSSGGYLQGLFTPTLYDSSNTENYKPNPADRAHVAIRLNIPYSGKYKLSISNTYYKETDTAYGPAHAATKVYFGAAPVSYSTAAINAIPSSSDYTALGWQLKNSMYIGEALASSTAVDGFTIDVPVAGEYYVAFLTFPESLTNWNSTVYASNGLQMFNLSSITLTPLPGEMGAEETAIAAVANTMTKDIAEESSHNLSNSAVVNVLTTTVNSDNDTSLHTVTPYTTTRGAELTVEAPKYDDYTFLYWTKGIGADRRVVSDSESYTLKAPAGGTYLTAVYKAKTDTQTSVVFFDAAGNELSRTLYDEGEAIVFPSVPSLTDHTFEGWALAGETGTVENATATGNQMIFVAQFSEEPTGKSVAVKVNGVATNYAYGSLVEVSATERKDGNGSDVFLYWTKDNEIVSFDKNYSFLAAENCGLEAVYGAYKPSITDSLRRIIISESFAEFIGLDAAKEKGVLFNKNGGEVSLETATHKIAVKNGGNQLKFENDLTSVASVIGYAIMDDDTVIYGK